MLVDGIQPDERSTWGMTFAFEDLTVTTWGRHNGQQLWRARRGEEVAEFVAARDSEVPVLYGLARAALERGR